MDEKLQKLGYTLYQERRRWDWERYLPLLLVGVVSLICTVTHVARLRDGNLLTERHQVELSIEHGYKAATYTILNLVTSLRTQLGTLDREIRIAKLLRMANCTQGFRQQTALPTPYIRLFLWRSSPTWAGMLDPEWV